MSVLFDINHPAHVHYFKHVIKRLKQSGRTVIVVARDKDVTLKLLDAYSIPNINRGRGGNGYVSRANYHVRAVKLLRDVILENDVQLVISFMHPYGAQAASLSGIKSIAFTDTENARLHHLFTVPFLDKVYSPEFFKTDLGNKHIRFEGFMEFAHLHPDVFQETESVFEELKIHKDEHYSIIRFVSRNSLHDVKHPGLSDGQKKQIVDRLSRYQRVFISSEIPLPADLLQYQLKIEPHKIHTILKRAQLYIGESATMASESAILGVPSIYIDNEGRGYTDELERKNRLLMRFEESDEGIQKALMEAEKYLMNKDSYFDSREMVSIDFKLSDFMFDVIENNYL